MTTNQTHPLLAIKEQIDETHLDLGGATAFSVLATKAKKCALIIAPSGAGKSTALDAVYGSSAGAIKIKALTQAGLVPYEDAFSNFNGLVVMEDLSAMGTEYRRIFTLSTMADLAYEHYTEVHTGHQHLSISNFDGAVLVGAQPVAMKGLIKDDMWEGTIQDKTLRYYHLYRPTSPSLGDPTLSVDWGIPLHDVELPDLSNTTITPLLKRLSIQWGSGRTLEHTSDLLRAAAALRESPKVETQDILAVTTLTRPMFVERYIIDKQDFEGERRVRSDFLNILIAFITYGTFTLDQICNDHKVSTQTGRRVMERYARMWVMIDKQPTTYAPSDELQRIINEVT